MTFVFKEYENKNGTGVMTLLKLKFSLAYNTKIVI